MRSPHPVLVATRLDERVPALPAGGLARSVQAAALLLSTAFAPHAAAQVYVNESVDGSGVVLSNFQSADAPRLLIDSSGAPGGSARAGAQASGATATRATSSSREAGLKLPAAPTDLRRVIDQVAAQVDLPPGLLHAVIAAESRYDPRALSPRGAIGLMQLLPATAKRFGAADPYAPQDNVRAGAQYLKWLMRMFENDLELVLAAYNAGEQAVVKAGRRIPPFAETRAYVPRVLAYLRCANDAACRPA